MMKISLLSILLTLFLCAALFANENKGNIEVKPSESIRFGNYIISLEDAIKIEAYGTISLRKQLNGGNSIVKYSNGIILQYDTNGKIVFAGLSTNSPLIKFKDKLFKVSDKSSVSKLLGSASSVVPVTSKDLYPESYELNIYAKDGISFQYDEDGKVTVVMVFKPALFGN